MKTAILGIDESTNAPLEIPLERIATRKECVTGMSSSGKTWTAAVYLEQLMDAGIPLVIFDNVGMWPGLARSYDGLTPAFPVAIFGGQFGHMPIRQDMGPAIARYCFNERVSTVVDMSQLYEDAQAGIVEETVRELMVLHSQRRQLVKLVFEEGHQYAAQEISSKAVARCTAEVKRAINTGRNFGLGFTFITQSLGQINITVRRAMELMVVHRMVESNAIKAVRQYIENLSALDEDRAAELMQAIPFLETGEAIVLSPAWLKLLTRVKVAQRRTYHIDVESEAALPFENDELMRGVEVEHLKRQFKQFMGAAAKSETTTARLQPAKETDDKVLELIRDRDALQEALDDAQRENEKLRTEQTQIVQQSVETATRNYQSRIEQMQANVKQALAVLSTLAEGQPLGPVSIVLPMQAVNKLVQRVENNSKLGGSHKRLVRTLAELYAELPDGVRRDKLASMMGLTPKALTNLFPDLKMYKYIVVTPDTVALNKDLL